jgi:predicted neuraminidase
MNIPKEKKLFFLLSVLTVTVFVFPFVVQSIGMRTADQKVINQVFQKVDSSGKVVSGAIVREFIFESAPFPSCHASTIVELQNGDLMAAWFGGTAEGNADVAIWGARRINGKWTAPTELVREPGTPTWNPVLFYTSDQKLWLYYKFGPNPSNWSAGRKWSTDHGNTWSEMEHLPAGLYGPIRAKPLIMADGTIISGTSVESYRNWAVWIERSSDHGKTWSKRGPITIPLQLYGQSVKNEVPKEVPGSSDWEKTVGIIQPSVISLGGKRLRLYARSTSKMGKVCVADSKDGGITWSQARPINVPNPNSGLDALQLKDGRVILIYNHTYSGRSPLNLAISKDGENFKMFYTLESEPGEFSYPNVIQGQNGDLHLTYTWKRKKIRYVHFKLSEIP